MLRNRRRQIGLRCGLLRRVFGMRLQETVQSQVVELFLILFAVRVGAELRSSGKALQERELLAAKKTPHEAFIDPNARFISPATHV